MLCPGGQGWTEGKPRSCSSGGLAPHVARTTTTRPFVRKRLPTDCPKGLFFRARSRKKWFNRHCLAGPQSLRRFKNELRSGSKIRPVTFFKCFSSARSQSE